ncbi:T9SS type A sorting domain-containing protein [Fidelibacter multiformis]|uniref:T9SS type A sorting domain-containing protein n=1 Tax=Fidelibacter multiformis TaxID=3377529 RepID=UPI0037DC8C60
MTHKNNFLWIIITIFLFVSLLTAGGNLYLVIGSDTGIWEGANTRVKHNYYRQGLYTDPSRNAYAIMDPVFRDSLRDSEGRIMPQTWWMHGGNMFRNATNTNFPLNNTMCLYLMKKYHGEAIKQYGDELTLHYHTWEWSDYNGDGIWVWNQTPSFVNCRQDFWETIGHYLLYEDVFPVSFRSGWHYMDNEWQADLDDFIPFSMHNAWPANWTWEMKKDSEPVNNVYVWVDAPNTFIPYHPSPENYQIPGDGRSWNTRSVGFGWVSESRMRPVFEEVNAGEDRLMCIWAHLPETDYVTETGRIHSVVRSLGEEYPDVKYHYLTGVDAMQAWLGTPDSIAPQVDLQVEEDAFGIQLSITSNEPIFQIHPFVAVENVKKELILPEPMEIGENTWFVRLGIPADDLYRLGVAVTDTVGNLTTEHYHFRPNDVWLDDESPEYDESRGYWKQTDNWAWGTSARTTPVLPGDSVTAGFDLSGLQKDTWNLFFQVPETANPVDRLTVRYVTEDTVILMNRFHHGVEPHQWIFGGTVNLDPADHPRVEFTGRNYSLQHQDLILDVVHLSACYTDGYLHTHKTNILEENASLYDTLLIDIPLQNSGITPVTLKNISLLHAEGLILEDITGELGPYARDTIYLAWYHESETHVVDTLRILWDPGDHEIRIPIDININNYYLIVDNEDDENYIEEGSWTTSITQAYGETSRYAKLSDGPSAVHYLFKPRVSGLYSVEEMIPKTENACDETDYILKVNGVTVDSIRLNQNRDYWDWRKIFESYLPEGSDVCFTVSQTNATSQFCLRADAAKIQLIDGDYVSTQKPLIPEKTTLDPVYPNPFNATAVIPFRLKERGEVSLRIYDVRGREVAGYVETFPQAGRYQYVFDGSRLSSGVYIVRFSHRDVNQSRKILLIK